MGVALVGVDRGVGHHPVTGALPIHPPLQQLHLVSQVQLCREGQLDLSGQLGVLPLLDGLDPVPELPPVVDPGRCILGGQDHGVLDGGPPGVVPGDPLPRIGQGVTGPVGGGRNHRLSGGTSDHLG
jgi:hypothetical protein